MSTLAKLAYDFRSHEPNCQSKFAARNLRNILSLLEHNANRPHIRGPRSNECRWTVSRG